MRVLLVDLWDLEWHQFLHIFMNLGVSLNKTDGFRALFLDSCWNLDSILFVETLAGHHDAVLTNSQVSGTHGDRDLVVVHTLF